MKASPLIGILDSGVNPALAAQVVAARAFVKTDAGEVRAVAAGPDRLGHGSALARVIACQIPEARFLVAQVFVDKLATSPMQAAAGLDWLVAQGARVVNMSFGLHADRAPLAEACQRALAAGVVLVSAAPAVGPSVFPAAYPGVIAVTGDVRCAAGEFSQLDASRADYGACVRAGERAVVGASVATAYLTGQVARYFNEAFNESFNETTNKTGEGPEGLHRWLAARATYRGVARHFEPVPLARRLVWQDAGQIAGEPS
ncbi:S8 family serine peptidase [Motiliproteus sp. SC1-56]|uniref:subtilisin-like serine protease QhpE n=1 Tax=Motiliproteus sp. SC1-56 TaxID=2799565 RepID=UPI001A8E1487|nr:S8 family serine peptidase [Motiliproteus sp. SC1-56]